MDKVPFYAKASLILIGFFTLITMLYILQDIIVPIIYSIMVAILLVPLVDFFVRKKMNRVLAITFSIILVSVAVFFSIVLLSSRLSSFTESFPKLFDKFYEILDQLILWLSSHFDISTKKLNLFITDFKTDMLNSSRSLIGSTINTVGNTILIILLIPVYVFMILFYQPLLLDFIRKVFGEKNQAEVNVVLTSTKKLTQNYLLGLLMEFALVAILNTVALLILGIKYAVILGIIGAILNIIPYLGGIVAVALPMIVALVTKDSAWYAVYVLIAYYFIQLLDNNFIVPKIVASKVKINALVSIIVVFLFGALWGISGMFLSIPLTAIIKVIFDNINSLKPWGFLLGDTMPTIEIFKIKFKKEKKINVTS
jgi:predicted PurR-regulated permease PerM